MVGARYGVGLLLVAGALQGCGGAQQSSLEPAAPPAPPARAAVCDSVAGEVGVSGAPGGARLAQGGCTAAGAPGGPRVAVEPEGAAALGAGDAGPDLGAGVAGPASGPGAAGTVCAEALPAPSGYVAVGGEGADC